MVKYYCMYSDYSEALLVCSGSSDMTHPYKESGKSGNNITVNTIQLSTNTEYSTSPLLGLHLLASGKPP
jgi:hypothetical protein